ncbi:uncharacterized protein LOC131149319 [Malania oleifera]|uniref:uncharacterized protein LOC131149319 n=1 Tax=Malania oleifera TaxID=397392 RepID=UPI0025AE64CE|nr:uncharacterized protein LOC131149319 [Malania oleifera]
MVSSHVSPTLSVLFLFHSLLFQLLYFVGAVTDTISQGQSLNVSGTIVSSGHEFELGFFRPGNSTSYYVGIWYKKVSVRTVAWVANDDLPIESPSPVLTFAADGNVVIVEGRITYAVTNASAGSNRSVTLLDNGNLVLRGGNSSAVLWQSFDYLSDTILPGMKLGYDKRTGKTWSLVSWKSSEDPRAGAFSMQLDPEGTSQLFIMQGTKRYWTTGTWNGHGFRLVREGGLDNLDNISFVSNQNETYLTFSGYKGNAVSRIVLDISGQIKLLTWSEETQQWSLNWSQPKQQCEVYAYCGAFGECNQNSNRFCDCMPGFVPRSPQNWRVGGMSEGCMRKVHLSCGGDRNSTEDEDGFLLMSPVMLPVDPVHLDVQTAVGCKSACLKNCSCSGYAYDSDGCSIWGGDLFNLQQLSEGDPNGREFNIKLAGPELRSSGTSSKRWLWIVLTPTGMITMLAAVFIAFRMWRRKYQIIGEDLLLFDFDNSLGSSGHEHTEPNDPRRGGKKEVELPLFSLASVSAATDNFSDANKLGEGGFGPVYKGKLQKGDEVAVKRLSRKSGQGWEELKNEATLIAKLQHKNLVRLLGCCIEKDEKILIYEYLPNKSLDFFLFDASKRGMLDWKTRTHIIKGIAQGLLYLHEYSRLRIIHRDLKASNILLDKDMNPKISDFGMARIFGGDESQATNRIVGTYGYMSPEYAMDGLFSVKSDVFSFGVLLLEILSGKKNTGLFYTDALNLLGHAWDLWKMGKELDLMDPALGDEPSADEQSRYINVALLCVQEHAADRPAMSDVISMLSNENQVLLTPKLPTSTIIKSLMDLDSSTTMPLVCSATDVSSSVTDAPIIICSAEAEATNHPIKFASSSNHDNWYLNIQIRWLLAGPPLSFNRACWGSQINIPETGTQSLRTCEGEEVMHFYFFAVIVQRMMAITANVWRMRQLFVHPAFFFLLGCSSVHLQLSGAATDTIFRGQEVKTSQTIVSAGNMFELGFFQPGSSTNFYVGIWYKKLSPRTVVWVANRDYAFTSASAVLSIGADGNIAISVGNVYYKVTNLTSSLNKNVSATLSDSGNFVLRDNKSDALLWQSFDHPSDTFLPGMKFGYNRRTGTNWSFVSWRTPEDPRPGAYSFALDPQGTSQGFIFKESKVYWTSGTWNGGIFSLVPEMRLNHVYNFSYISNEDETYFTYELYDRSIISRFVMDVSGQIQQLTWLEGTQWNLFWSQPGQQCEVYALCGPFGVCNQESMPFCGCLHGFEPRSPNDWSKSTNYDGCVRRVSLQCGDTTATNGVEDKFLKLFSMKYPVNPQNLVIRSDQECRLACLNDCSCSAYAYKGSGGCSMWNGSLLNLQKLPDEYKDDGTIYIRLAASEFAGSRGKKKLLLLVIVPVLFLAFLLLSSGICRRWRKRLKQKGKRETSQDLLLFDPGVSITTTKDQLSSENVASRGKSEDSGFPLFSFASVSAATEDFSTENKLGEGGFGPVYKGKLLKGQEVAVKRLSKRSGQGLDELKNEAVVIAKLQHMNLVRLLGCCLEHDEKILIYEYMPNKSLDSFLFDPTKRRLLDWATRVHVIEGIAQGLLYLHQYSRLRIIHRDLKASNILLDKDMNPKISDFGMARIFGGNELQANTNRIVGTYGYMPPEYALEGLFSIKSDVFSFGVLLLEILSGKKNTGFYQSDSLNLLGYAWDLWKSSRAQDLMDPVLEDQPPKHMLLRYINVALLCVQEIAADRPTMLEVVLMLSNELASLPSPKQPAFSFVRTATNPNSPIPKVCSINGVTVSVLEPR